MKFKFTFIGLIFITAGALQAQELRFTILHTNDEHSNLIPIPSIDDHPEFDNSALGGFARLASAVQDIREQKAEVGEPVLLFSGGDHLGGPAFGWLPLMDNMAAEMKLFQQIGYDAVTIGNHEFDYGPDIYANYLNSAGYPSEIEPVILGTNIRPPDDHSLYEAGIQNFFIKELENGLRVGVFGLIGNDAISKTADTGPLEFDDPIESAKRAVSELSDAGVDVIISVNHSGVDEDRQLAEAIPDIDVIVGGHSHTALHEPIIIGKTVIVQAGEYLNYLGMLELSWNAADQRVSVLNTENRNPFLKLLDQTVTKDEEVESRVQSYKDTLDAWVQELTNNRINDVREVVAYSDFPIVRNSPQLESAIGNYVTDAMKMSAENVLGKPVDIAVQANGAIRGDIRPGMQEWNKGEISFYDLMSAVGLGAGADGNPGYPLVSLYVTADEVRRALEVSVLLSGLMGDNYFLQFSGLNMLYDPNRAVLLNIPFSGTPIPTSRAILSAEFNTRSEELRSIEKGSDELIHVVTDYYIAGFLPQVGNVVPNLAIQLKDENGRPVELDDTVIMHEGTQLKVWQAVLNYTLSQNQNENGLPVIPAQYEQPEGRLAVTSTLPLWIWPVVALIVLVSVIVFSIKRR